MENPAKEPIIDGEPFDIEAEMAGPQSAKLTETKGSADDTRAMWRMGKVQEMQRNFRFLSIFGFSMILMASWETMLG